jgi:orotate phosphoribosyltransferase
MEAQVDFGMHMGGVPLAALLALAIFDFPH